jgi:hypothetical protein
LAVREFELSFTLARQVCYHFSHTSSPFFSSYFGDRGLTNYLLGLALNHNLPDLSLPSSYDYRCEPPVPGQQNCYVGMLTGATSDL